MKNIFWDEYLDTLSGWGIAAIGVVLMIVIFFISFTATRKSCLVGYEAYSPSWSIFAGCRIDWQGKLTPVSIIKNISIE